jgi:hypothetical protein
MRRARSLLAATAIAATLPLTAHAAPSAGTYQTEYTATACGARVAIPVSAGETALAVTAAATVPANDIVLNVFRNGAQLGSADSATSPEAFVTTKLDPPAAAGDVVEAQVCPFADPTAPATAPYTATGTYAWGTVPATPAVASPGEPADGKKDVRVPVLDDVLIPWGAPGAGAEVAFPSGTYNAAELVLHDHPDGDGFDRLLTVEVDGVEMFRATTPRVDYAIRWDVTPYLALLSGGTHRVFVHEESYLGRGHVVSLDFVLHAAKKAPPAMATTVEAPWDYAGLAPHTGGGCGGNLGDVNLDYTASIDETRTFSLPADGEPVRAATFYGYLTAHGCEEFWYSTARPTPVRMVHLAIDGTAFADFVPKPYTYAFVGGDPNDQTWNTADQAAWNTAQPVAAEHGVYDGTGAIPPYVFDVTDVVKGLAAGPHDLTIRIDNGDGSWVFSGQVLVAFGKGRPAA